MDFEIRKDLTSNWFKTLQDSICHSISELEKNKNKLKIPMKNNKRSLNVSSSVAIILAESLRQTNLI